MSVVHRLLDRHRHGVPSRLIGYFSRACGARYSVHVRGYPGTQVLVSHAVSLGRPLPPGTLPGGFYWSLPAAERERVLMSFLQNRGLTPAPPVAEPSDSGSRFARENDALTEWMTATEFPDGTSRLTSTLTLFCDGGAWKDVLRDRQTSTSLWVTSGSLLDVLAALDGNLRMGTGDWRQEKQVGGVSKHTRGGKRA